MAKSKEILFAEWIAANHYRLVNIIDEIYYWENETNVYSTDALLHLFELENAPNTNI